MEEKPLIPINIVIADRSFRLKIEQEDEEMVRKTMKMINEKIVEFRSSFAGKDMQDYISMVLLWYATEQQKPTVAQVESDNLQQRLAKLESKLDRFLQ